MKNNHSNDLEQRRHPAYCRGFTLVELLVCIATIAVLASLSVGAAIYAKASAKSIKCKSNLRQLGQLLTVFAEEHQKYPLLSASPAALANEPDNNGSWISSIALDQVNSLKAQFRGQKDFQSSVLLCPSVVQKALATPDGLGQSPPYLYGYNGVGAPTGPDYEPRGIGFRDSSRVRAVSTSDVVQPSNMYAIGDAGIGWKDKHRDSTLSIGRNPRVTDQDGALVRLVKLHRGSLNMVYCDGHVDARTLHALYESTIPDDVRRWNRDGSAGIE